MSGLLDAVLGPMQYPFMQRALLAAAMVGLISAVLSCFLVVKRWALLGDAISHAVLPGVAIAYLLRWDFFIGAALAGILTALGIGFVEQKSRVKEDTAMGIMFTGAFALGIAILSAIRTKSQDLYHILFGNVLGVSDRDLWLTAITGALVLVVVWWLYKELVWWTFDPTMAAATGLRTGVLHYTLMVLLTLTIVASLQAVGIVLVVAMLITPGATAYLLASRLPPMIALASLIGVASGVSGLYASYYLNIASGPTMVVAATLFFFAALFLSPRGGLVWRSLRRWRTARVTALEDALKHVWALEAGGDAVAVADLARDLGRTGRSARRLVDRLEQQGLAAREPGTGATRLTARGLERAQQLVRSHRLWERYLVDEAGMPWDAVHGEAHRLEHVTPEAVADELSEALGHPATDPHGEPIPAKAGPVSRPADLPLAALAPGHGARVRRVDDVDPGALRRLAALGLVPGAWVEVAARQDGELELRVRAPEAAEAGEAAEARTARVPEALAARVFVRENG